MGPAWKARNKRTSEDFTVIFVQFLGQKTLSLTESANYDPAARILAFFMFLQASQVAQLVRHLPATQETLGSFLNREDSPGEGIGCPVQYSWVSLVAQMVKNPPVIWETWVQSPCWGDPLEESMATRASILAWRSPRTEEPGRSQSVWSQRVGHN